MYEGERKRANQGVEQKPKVTFMQGLRLWANQWRWSNIKKTWQQEYKLHYYRTTNNVLHYTNKLR